MSNNISKAYDHISKTYDADYMNIHADTRGLAIRQIINYRRDYANILDCAVGTGRFLTELLPQIDHSQVVANDFSQGMLDKAQQVLPSGSQFICDDINHLMSSLPVESFDLILSHYLFAFVPFLKILDMSHKLLTPGGCLSIMTTTKKNLNDFFRYKLAKSIFHVDRKVAKLIVPDNKSMLLHEARQQFDVVSIDSYDKELMLYSKNDFFEWACDSGWLTDYFSGSMLFFKKLLAHFGLTIGPIFNRKFYPVSAKHDIIIMLITKL